jgi:hypothetical protein
MSEYYDPTIDTLPRHAQRVLKKSKDLPIEMLLMCVDNNTDLVRIGTSIARDFPSFGLLSDETQLQIMARALGFPTIASYSKYVEIVDCIRVYREYGLPDTTTPQDFTAFIQAYSRVDSNLYSRLRLTKLRNPGVVLSQE